MKGSLAPLVERLGALDCTASSADDLRGALADVKRLRAWTDAREAAVVAALEVAVSFPERAITDTQQVPFRDAERALARAQFLRDVPVFAAALEAGAITIGHVDVLMRAARKLEPAARAVLLGEADRLVTFAGSLDVDTFTRRVRQRCALLRSDEDDEARFERQRRATSLRSWVDQITGMWCFHGEFDPLTGLQLDQALRAQLERLFHDALPNTAPTDPLVRQQHLAALAFADLVLNPGGASRARPEVVAVIDLTDAPAQIEWNLPIEVPKRVMDALLGQADLSVVVVRNGVVIDAPGCLDEGRNKRTANRAQRRALRGFYRCCAIPGCSVPFDRCKIHHLRYWERGGPTNLDNLLPLCSKHHHCVHDCGWAVTMGPDRSLRIDLPDGTTMTTGPPSRRQAG
jgi:hypothetical protein